MDLEKMEALSLPGPDGQQHRLGDFWAEQPVILLFLRHFGCLMCREHAVTMKDHYDQIRSRGAELVAIGTGDQRYAARFVSDESIPYPVLVDDDGVAARAAAVRTIPLAQLLFDVRSYPGGIRARRAGFKTRRSGNRVSQLAGTFVVGPGPKLRYQHTAKHSADHPPLDEVLAALQ